ncbi:MAG: Smr/MutS family protein [Deltaproteobacteria bacterium]|nr:Smr/MutS family protein [Deltaproteobacteria bacterium]
MSSTFTVSNRCLEDLGWSRIIRALAARAGTDVGRLAAEALAFFPGADEARQCLRRVDELTEHLRLGGRLPLDGTSDIRALVNRAARGATLDKDELLAVSDTARAAVRVKRSLAERGAAELGAIGAAMPELGTLSAELAATFDRAGNIRDDASPELAAARLRASGLRQRIKDRLDQFLARPDVQEVCQDNFYTEREDRYVVPIVASFQAQVPGIIHGASNTGQTVYIEPTEFIEANNAIKVAVAQIEVETRKVLRIRSEWVGSEAAELIAAFDTLVDLDLLQARAQLAIDLDASTPALAPSTGGLLRLKRARNPHLVLKGANVVPNDIELAPEQAFLVVTGPNTGGKTVTLSTVGACALMVRAGIPIPADPESVIPLYDGVFALVGDHQDIEQDLSTFSGHLQAVRQVLDEAHDGALVLLDELIVGTEPAQGAALAIAVLESLARRGARGFVTTHYERLKTLAFEDPRFGNANVGIDPRTLAPTFVLTNGEPGASNPLDIAARLGLSPTILGRARELAGGDEGIAAAVARLAEARKLAEDAQQAAQRRELELLQRTRELEAEKARLRRESEREIAALHQEVRRAARAALEEVKAKTAELQKANDLREVAKAREEVVAMVDALPALPEEPKKPIATKPKEPGPHDAGDITPDVLEPGLAIWVRPLGQPGVVAEVHGRRAVVAVGSFKSTIGVDEIGRLGGPRKDDGGGKAAAVRVLTPDEDAPAPELGDSDNTVPTPQGADNTVDLRGARRDEVAEQVEPLLDRAFREGLGAVWIIHGHGTGVIKDEVRQLIRRSKLVTKWRAGRRHEGGDGVTIAWVPAQ